MILSNLAVGGPYLVPKLIRSSNCHNGFLNGPMSVEHLPTPTHLPVRNHEMSLSQQSIIFMPVTSKGVESDRDGPQRQPQLDQKITNTPLPHKEPSSSCSEINQINHFRNVPDQQASSTLLQLPAELQLEVLRYLLLHGRPIETWKSHYEDWERKEKSPATKKSEWLSLSPQILRCCQLLYQNGTNILYHENTITLEAFNYPGLYTRQACFITTLDECTRFLERPYDSSLDSLPGRTWLSRFLKGRPRNQLQYDPGQLSNVTAQMLLRFQKIRVTIDIDHAEASGTGQNMYLYALAYILRKYVAAKDVEVSMDLTNGDISKKVLQLKCFELWRCKSIRFWDTFTKSIVSDHAIRMTQQVIRSPAPVQDLELVLSIYKELAPQREHFLRNGLPDYFERSRWWNLAKEAMIKQNEQEFRSHMVNLLEGILGQMDSDLDDARTDARLEANSENPDEEYHDALDELHLLEDKMGSRRKDLQLILVKTRQD